MLGQITPVAMWGVILTGKNILLELTSSIVLVLSHEFSDLGVSFSILQLLLYLILSFANMNLGLTQFTLNPCYSSYSPSISSIVLWCGAV